MRGELGDVLGHAQQHERGALVVLARHEALGAHVRVQQQQLAVQLARRRHAVLGELLLRLEEDRVRDLVVAHLLLLLRDQHGGDGGARVVADGHVQAEDWGDEETGYREYMEEVRGLMSTIDAMWIDMSECERIRMPEHSTVIRVLGLAVDVARQVVVQQPHQRLALGPPRAPLDDGDRARNARVVAGREAELDGARKLAAHGVVLASLRVGSRGGRAREHDSDNINGDEHDMLGG